MADQCPGRPGPAGARHQAPPLQPVPAWRRRLPRGRARAAGPGRAAAAVRGGARQGPLLRLLGAAVLEVLRLMQSQTRSFAGSTQVGALVAQDASLLRHFFRSDPKRVPLWFGHFRCAICAPCRAAAAMQDMGARLAAAAAARLLGKMGLPTARAALPRPCAPAAWRACGGSALAPPRWRGTRWPTAPRCVGRAPA